MRRSLSHGTGFLEINHRDSPGLRPEDVAHVPGAVAVPGGQHYETDVYQCSHCQRTVVLHATSAARMAARGYCPKCDRYVCNSCEKARVASGGQCVPFKAVFDRVADVSAKFAGQMDHPDAVIDPQAIQSDIAATPKVATPSIILTDA